MNEEEAKRAAAGPLGDEMSKFPARFCNAIMFGRPPSREHPVSINNGTASLVRVDKELYAITCWHVMEEYRRQTASGKTFFAIGNLHFDPVPQIYAEDQAKDFTIIKLNERQAKIVNYGDKPIGVDFFSANEEPRPAAVENYVAFAGFPGDLRQYISFDEISFGTYSSGSCRVTDSHADYITCQFEKEHWITNFKEREPAHLGGMSGGPAFTLRTSAAGINYYEFAGIIYRMHDDSQSLFIRIANALPLPWKKPVS